ncbi:DMT family transporter [Planktotalea sp.]|uniref:DMT family transporter n=1 Tax=Planktotalea sp. TaxID=2029877 RepID=UPI003D6A95D7
MDRKENLDALGIAALLGFATMFAFNQVVIKVTIEGLQPVFLAGLRSLIGFAALLVWMKLRRVPITMTRAQLWGGALAGVLFSLEFLCIFLALDITSVSRASVLFYSMPIWLGLIAHFVLPGERLSGTRLLGFALSICGVAWALFDRSSGTANLWGDILALTGAFCWAGIALTVRLTAVSEASAEMQLMCQLVISALVFMALAPFFGPFVREFTAIHLAGLLYQSIILVLFGFMMWFALMKIYPASDIASFSFLSPVLSVLLGWWLLDEEIGLGIIGALLLVCVGLVLIARRPKARQP